ncbi:hypothetical protein Tco_0246880 [Tanacetum coccineum]
MYVDGHVDIFYMVDIDLFTIVALSMMVVQLGYTGKSEPVYAPTKEPFCDSVTLRSLPQHDSSTPCKDSVCESITPRCMPHCMLTPPTDEFVIKYTQLSGVQGVDTQNHVIEDVIRQLPFEETKLDGEARFNDVARSGTDDDDDADFLVDKENEIVKPDVDVHLFVLSSAFERSFQQYRRSETLVLSGDLSSKLSSPAVQQLWTLYPEKQTANLF